MFGKKELILRNGMYEQSSNFELDVQTVNFINKSNNDDPVFAHVGDSGMDLRAFITKEEEGVKINKENNKPYITLKPLERRLIHTGIYFELPSFTEIQVRPRSGCAYEQGLTVLNTPGTIDEKYINEIGIIAINLSSKSIKIENGDRIAQAVLMPVYNSHLVKLNKVEEISENRYRNRNGFGSTGKKEIKV